MNEQETLDLPIKDIIIGPRQREDLGDIEGMADSFKRLGQIQAIGVNEGNVLIWGRRRLAGATLLGWEKIRAVRRHGLKPLDEKLIEWEEDYRQKPRNFKEKCIALADLYEQIKAAKWADGDEWTQQNMVDFTGVGSRTSLSYMLEAARALKADPDGPMKDALSIRDAIKLVAEQRQREATSELERRRQNIPSAPVPTIISEEVGMPSEFQVEGESMLTINMDRVEIRLRCFSDWERLGESKLTILNNFPTEDMEHGSPLVGIIVHFMSPNAYAYYSNGIKSMEHIQIQPWPIVWATPATPLNHGWPFSMNMKFGLVVFPKGAETRIENPESSCIVTPQYGTDLPTEVVHRLCTLLTNDGDPVLCLGDVNPVDVASIGRVPTIFEPDDEKLRVRIKELGDWYLGNVPGAVIV